MSTDNRMAHAGDFVNDPKLASVMVRNGSKKTVVPGTSARSTALANTHELVAEAVRNEETYVDPELRRDHATARKILTDTYAAITGSADAPPLNNIGWAIKKIIEHSETHIKDTGTDLAAALKIDLEQRFIKPRIPVEPSRGAGIAS